MIKKLSRLFLIPWMVVILPHIALSGGVIKIGAPTPLTGSYAYDGLGYRQCLEFAVEEINAQGGLLGKKLEIVTFDIGVFSPEKLMQAAAVLINREKVDTVHGGWSGWGQNVRAFGKYTVPTFFADASISSIEVYKKAPQKYANIFQMCEVEKPLAIGVFDAMNALPYRYTNNKIAIIVTDDAFGREIGDAMKTRAIEKGWEVAIFEVVPYGIREWGPLLTKIRNINPAWIHFEVVSPPDAIAFFRQFKKSPSQSLLNFGYGLMPPDLVKTLGQEANGILGKVVFGMPLPQGPTPEADAWLKKFRARFGNDPLAAGYTSYVSLKMWAEAVRQVGDEKKYSEINNRLAQMTYNCVAGGVWRFDKNHKIPMSTETPMLIMQVQDGKLVTIYRGVGISYKNNHFRKPGWLN